MPGQQQLVKCGKYVAEVCALQSDLRGLQYKHPCGFIFPPFSSMFAMFNSLTSKVLVQGKRQFSATALFPPLVFISYNLYHFNRSQFCLSVTWWIPENSIIALVAQKIWHWASGSWWGVCVLYWRDPTHQQRIWKKPDLLTSRYYRESRVLFLCLVFLVFPV